MNPIAIDPPGCGCTECITGEYVPLNDATPRHIADMLAGRIGNNTSLTFTLTLVGKFDDRPRWPFDMATVDEFTVATEAVVHPRWHDSDFTTQSFSWRIDQAMLAGAEEPTS